MLFGTNSMLQGFLEVEVMKLNVGIERIDDRLVGIDKLIIDSDMKVAESGKLYL